MLADKLGARVSLPTFYQMFCPPFALPAPGLVHGTQPSLQPAGAVGRGDEIWTWDPVIPQDKQGSK